MTSELKGLTKEILPGRKLISMQQIHQLCTDFVAVTCNCRTDMHQGNYNSVYFLGRKLNSMQSCKSIVTMVFECYFFNQLLHCIYRYGLHYNVLLEMMMSVLQEVKGLTKKLYFIILEDQFPC